MEAPEPIAVLRVVGPGRVGLALGLALQRARAVRHLQYSGRNPNPPVHPLFSDADAPADYSASLSFPDPAPDAVIIAVPDAEIADVARLLAEQPFLPRTPVLHTSGALGLEVLAPLATAGCSVGSLHPLTAIADPVDDAELLRGAWFAVEGQTDARIFAQRLVAFLGGRVLNLTDGAKPLYHAAAVFASNYVVTLLDVAERLMRQAGARPDHARIALGELALGAVEAVRRDGPAGALTGPVSRGDTETIELHLARLSPPDGLLYSVLARETLALARRRGLDPSLAARTLHSLEGAG